MINISNTYTKLFYSKEVKYNLVSPHTDDDLVNCFIYQVFVILNNYVNLFTQLRISTVLWHNNYQVDCEKTIEYL